jgi:hypothetical protein
MILSWYARAKVVMSAVAVTRAVLYRAAHALSPSATAKCFLPAPRGPSSSKSSASARKGQVANSRWAFA